MIDATAHPNLALIKYWGKRDERLKIPATPSLSIPLLGVETRTRLEKSARGKDEVLIDGRPDPSGRVLAWLDLLRASFGVPLPPLSIDSRNNFPTASGLASSASGFAALARGVNELLGLGWSQEDLSRMARLGSASAARSVKSGHMELIGSDSDHGSWHARELLDWSAWPLGVSVAICAESTKPLSSSEGMRRGRETSPRYGDWLGGNERLFHAARQAVLARDFDALAQAATWSFFGMLSVMSTSKPPVVYLNRISHAVVAAVEELRGAGVKAFFTSDAGAQVKCVYLPEHESDVRACLAEIPGVSRVLRLCP